MKPIVLKEKKAVFGNLLIFFIIILLQALAIFRLLSKNDYRPVINLIYIALVIITIFYFIKELISLISFLKIPSVLAYIDNDKVVLNDHNKTSISFNKIQSIDKGLIHNSNYLFYECTLVIRTSNQSFPLKYVKNLEKTIDALQKIVIDNSSPE